MATCPFDPRYVRLGFNLTRHYSLGELEFTETPCFYCGEPGITEDHTFPRVAIETLSDDPELLKRRLLRIVPCCHECNSLLNSKVFRDLETRKRYVKQQLRKRYKRLLDLPEWDDYELAQLKGRLRQHVLISLAHRDRILERLKWGKLHFVQNKRSALGRHPKAHPPPCVDSSPILVR